MPRSFYARILDIKLRFTCGQWNLYLDFVHNFSTKNFQCNTLLVNQVLISDFNSQDIQQNVFVNSCSDKLLRHEF